MWTLVSRRRLIKRKTGLWHPVRIGCSGILWRTWERPFALGAENGSPLFIQKMEPWMAQWTSLALGPGRGGGAALSNPFEKGFKNSRLRLQVLRNTQNQTVRHRIRMVLSLSGRRPDSDQATETSSPASAPLWNHSHASSSNSPAPGPPLSRIHSEVSGARKGEANWAISTYAKSDVGFWTRSQ